ncbi:uncharacterized protein B0J16DRAFT_392620 [Fusarium flagelliforme]|uniref:uncharacterized protein n=1 Tax=Fusarium flagelliforme TaxID=2675880 RepID=UPI001E8E9431|nr:uncharacterized protein B0J16DRAFT_392620 [Fusarium flagelliforme]KAH7198826.1 hypothetical protein B0J16DRAFT_392620 [Fusarium flagelliforme]
MSPSDRDGIMGPYDIWDDDNHVAFPKKESSVAPKVDSWPTPSGEAILSPVYPADSVTQVLAPSAVISDIILLLARLHHRTPPTRPTVPYGFNKVTMHSSNYLTLYPKVAMVYAYTGSPSASSPGYHLLRVKPEMEAGGTQTTLLALNLRVQWPQRQRHHSQRPDDLRDIFLTLKEESIAKLQSASQSPLYIRNARSGPITSLDGDLHKFLSTYAVLQNIKDDVKHRQSHDHKLQELIADVTITN